MTRVLFVSFREQSHTPSLYTGSCEATDAIGSLHHHATSPGSARLLVLQDALRNICSAFSRRRDQRAGLVAELYAVTTTLR